MSIPAIESAVDTAVVLLNLGGPSNLDEVEPFLFNIFADPDVVQFPWGRLGQRWIARRMARTRGPEARENYRKIGDRSPLLELTRRQGAALERELGPGFKTYIAMRAWHPDTERAIDDVVADGARRVVALPCYPHWSRATTGSSLRELRRVLAQRAPSLPLHAVESYPSEPLYLQAWHERIAETLASIPDARRPTAHILFSAHGLPKKLVDGGDPYLVQLQETVAATMRPFAAHASTLAFQSRATRVEWLSPSTQEAIAALAARGVRDLVVVPVSFVTDHVETLFELDLLIRDEAHRQGIEGYWRVGSLNESPTLIRAFADLVRSKLNG